ncbi:MAG: hypothetical protein BGO26_06675 [Actinobacteria bacterium 69-20]|nr:hypothetical protein [Actinomycetota bacterium]OJV28119.1 MAG: hypothetical protein BGO26_06675 [Actinobacteria bacterium 69-20]
MRLIPLPRRHRLLWLVAAVLAVSAWGSWLVATGRATDYGSGFAHVPLSTSAAAPVSRAPGVPDVAELLMTSSTPEPLPTTAAVILPSVSVAGSRGSLSASAAIGNSDASGAAASSLAGLAGMTDPLVFARAVAHTVLTFSPRVDLGARTTAVMAVAALPPIGSPSELAADLRSFDPDPVARYGGGTVTFIPDSITPSPWAAARLDQLGLPAGSFAIDVTGNQLVTYPGHQPVSVAVTIGITGACPPALTQCEIDRIFPRTVAQELGS